VVRLWLMMSLGGLVLGGCSSPGKPDSARFASVSIRGHTVDQVRDATSQVFHADGFKVIKKGWANLLLEKEGSSMNNIAYGNWMGSGIWVRAKVTIVDIAPSESRIDCEAFLVRTKDGATEEEIKINKLHRHHYQKLLDEVSRRLSAPLPKLN
jgi:hypothetical protein